MFWRSESLFTWDTKENGRLTRVGFDFEAQTLALYVQILGQVIRLLT